MLHLWLLACRPDDDRPQGDVASDFALTVDAEMGLMVHATWTEPELAADRWVELRLPGGDWTVAPALGPGRAVLLGIPAETEVEARPGFTIGGEIVYGPVETAITAALPPEVLVPTVVAYDEELADPAPYAMITVTGGQRTFEGPYVLTILDRHGDVVWYHALPADVLSFYGSPARDGTHIWYEMEQIFLPGETDTGLVRQTLDGRWTAFWPVEHLGQAVAEAEPGSFLVERRGYTGYGLDRVGPDGAIDQVWDCAADFAELGLSDTLCLLNTCNVDLERNTALATQFRTGTVFEVDLATGEVSRQMGQLDEVGEPYAFEPADANFAYPHDTRWTPEGTLMVSTHEPCPEEDVDCDPVRGRPGVQRASEYAVDDDARTLTRIWSYRSTDRWATQWGEAIPLPNGNVVQGYGQDGAVREVTRDGEIAWEVAWPKGFDGFRLIGHLTLVEDLYALNAGP